MRRDETSPSRTITDMGIFSKKPEQSAKEQGGRILMMPLSPYEAAEIVEILVGIRTGDKSREESGKLTLQKWEIRRSMVAFGVLAERYFNYLVDIKLLKMGENEQQVVEAARQIALAIPEATRVDERVILEAIVATFSKNSESVRRRIQENPEQVLLGFVYLCAGLCNLANSLHGKSNPSMSEMLKDINAPW